MTATLGSGFVAETADRQEKRRRAISGAVFSEFIDMFDIYLPTVVLSPVLFYFQPAKLDPGEQAIFASLVFITTLLGRPIGALAFGVVADRFGRRMASITSVAGFGVITFLIALIPGYRQIGIASYWLLVILRFVDGICLGGGYTGAHPLAIEYSKKEQRGFTGGLILSAFPAAYVAITLVAMLMFAIFPLAGAEFALCALGLANSLRHRGAARLRPHVLLHLHSLGIRDLGDRRRAKTGKNAAQRSHLGPERTQSPAGAGHDDRVLADAKHHHHFHPDHAFAAMLKLSKYALTSTLLISYAALFFSYIASGMIGQRIGRRRFFVIVGPLIAVIGSAILYYLIRTPDLSLGAIMALVCVLSILVTSPWGVIITYINERFVTDVRATGFGIGFSLSVIIPSFYAFYMNWLGAVMPFELTPVFLLGVGAIIGTIGAAMGPETKDVDFH